MAIASSAQQVTPVLTDPADMSGNSPPRRMGMIDEYHRSLQAAESRAAAAEASAARAEARAAVLQSTLESMVLAMTLHTQLPGSLAASARQSSSADCSASLTCPTEEPRASVVVA